MKTFFKTLSTTLPTLGFVGAATAQTAPEPAQPQNAANAFEGLMPPIDGITAKIHAGFWAANWPWILVGALVVAVILFVVLRPRKKRVLTPYEIAVQRLGSAANAFASGGAKAYAEEVGNAVRNYIEAVYKIPAPERTTEEFLDIAANSANLATGDAALIEKILRLADMAKFARHSFKENEKAEILQTAFDFIENDNKKRLAKESADKTAADKAEGISGK